MYYKIFKIDYGEHRILFIYFTHYFTHMVRKDLVNEENEEEFK